MRGVAVKVPLAALVFVACNGILGNEDHYSLVAASGGHGGAPAVIGAAGEAGTIETNDGSNAGGKGGNTGASGSQATGGRVLSAGGAGGGVEEGGSAGEPSESGAGGGSACVPSGVEDCFNGMDDDCNGKVDCADAACAAPATCVADVRGATLGTFVGAMESCPTGYSPRTLLRGLTADAQCAGCSCVPDESRCESGVYGHGSYTCPSYQYDGLLYNVFSTSCEIIAQDTSVHFFDVRGFTTCTAQGTPTLPDPTWAESRTFCAADRTGGGCGSGYRCVPALSTKVCSLSPGLTSCGADYPDDTGGTWYTKYSDNRSCPACSCAFGSADCAGAYIQAFSEVGCTGAMTPLGSGAEGDLCALPFVPRAGRVIGTPSGGSCEPNTYAYGSLDPADPQTTCCQ